MYRQNAGREFPGQDFHHSNWRKRFCGTIAYDFMKKFDPRKEQNRSTKRNVGDCREMFLLYRIEDEWKQQPHRLEMEAMVFYLG